MHMVPIDRSNMNHHLVTSRDLTDQLAHEDQRPLPTLDIDISLPTRYDTYSPRSYGCQISPSASHRMLRIPSPKGEGFTDPQNATLNRLAGEIFVERHENVQCVDRLRSGLQSTTPAMPRGFKEFSCRSASGPHAD